MAYLASKRTWRPEPAQIKELIGKDFKEPKRDEWKPDTLRINADRIKRGEHVGEGYLWGRQAADMLREGYVRMSELRAYRSSVFFQERKLYGEETARKREQEREARHQHAVKVIAEREQMMRAAE